MFTEERTEIYSTEHELQRGQKICNRSSQNNGSYSNMRQEMGVEAEKRICWFLCLFFVFCFLKRKAILCALGISTLMLLSMEMYGPKDQKRIALCIDSACNVPSADVPSENQTTMNTITFYIFQANVFNVFYFSKLTLFLRMLKSKFL